MKTITLSIDKRMFLIAAIIFLAALSSGRARAVVTGQCSNCHTMHYSQGGTQLSGWGSDGPYQSLTINNCVGCHSATDGATWRDSVTGAPIVYNAAEPSYNTQRGLAAGNFYYVTQDQSKGHNVTVVPGVSQDTNFSSTPGWSGEINGCAACHGGSNMVLAKCIFCHNAKSAHHADDSTTVVDQTGGYYRFLSFSAFHPSSFQESLGFSGVKGIEDPNWEKNPTSTAHNEYCGSQDGNFNTIDNGISDYCSCCHPKFHGSTDTGGSSPWLRHPAYIALPNSGEYASYTIYNPQAPVARDPATLAGMAAPSETVTPGSDQVSCISCHRAHGTPYPDILRWDYTSTTHAAANEGCVVCHTQK